MVAVNVECSCQLLYFILSGGEEAWEACKIHIPKWFIYIQYSHRIVRILHLDFPLQEPQFSLANWEKLIFYFKLSKWYSFLLSCSENNQPTWGLFFFSFFELSSLPLKKKYMENRALQWNLANTAVPSTMTQLLFLVSECQKVSDCSVRRMLTL